MLRKTSYFFRYLCENREALESSARRLAEIVGYDWQPPTDVNDEQKKPTQVFLGGLDAGCVVSLADEKVYEPTHSAILEYYRPEEPLADHLR